jgi:hypothetical protein
MSEPLSPHAYTAAGGRVCPYCRWTDLTRGPLRLEAGIAVTQRVACRTCQARWNAVFELMGYEPAQEEESLC